MLNTTNPLLRTNLPLLFDAYFVGNVKCVNCVRMYYYLYVKNHSRKLIHFWTTYKPSSKLSEDLAVRRLFGKANAYLDSLLKS